MAMVVYYYVVRVAQPMPAASGKHVYFTVFYAVSAARPNTHTNATGYSGTYRCWLLKLATALKSGKRHRRWSGFDEPSKFEPALNGAQATHDLDRHALMG